MVPAVGQPATAGMMPSSDSEDDDYEPVPVKPKAAPAAAPAAAKVPHDVPHRELYCLAPCHDGSCHHSSLTFDHETGHEDMCCDLQPSTYQCRGTEAPLLSMCTCQIVQSVDGQVVCNSAT